MPKTYTISKEVAEAVKKHREKTRDKQVDKRLHAVQLRGEGKKNEAIAVQLETSTDMVSRWISAYAKGGIEALLPKARPGRPTNISREEETKLNESNRTNLGMDSSAWFSQWGLSDT